MNSTRSTLIGTAVAIALFGQNDPAQSAATGRGSRHRYSRVEPAIAGHEARREFGHRGRHRRRHRQDARQERRRFAGAAPRHHDQSAGANEGGFDENDRISMRGTSPSLTQTLLNGHNVASGDWFVLEPVRQVGRSVSYTLLPSELVDQVVVHKSSQASLVEGGVAGSVDIITRKPLDFAEQFTLRRVLRHGLRGAARRDGSADERPLQLEERRWHAWRDGAGILGRASLASRRRRDPGLRDNRSRSAMATSNPDLPACQYPYRSARRSSSRNASALEGWWTSNSGRATN